MQRRTFLRAIGLGAVGSIVPAQLTWTSLDAPAPLTLDVRYLNGLCTLR